MPRRDGTGPTEFGNYGGRMGGPESGGPIGYCECPQCGEKAKHVRGTPCTSRKCPKCGQRMIRA